MISFLLYKVYQEKRKEFLKLLLKLQAQLREFKSENGNL